MFGFTRKTDYAFVGLATLAKEGASRERPMSARQIAEQYGLPLPLLMQLLKDLHRAGLVESVRGAAGGYYLAVSPDEITLTSVIAAIEDPIRVTLCCDVHDDDQCVTCNLAVRCPIITNVRKLNEKIVMLLSQATIGQLIDSGGIDVPCEQVGATDSGTEQDTLHPLRRKSR